MNEPRDSPYPELKKTHTMAHTGRPWTDHKPPPAAPVWAVIEGYGRFHTLVAALELDVFDLLERHGPSTADELAEMTGASAPHLATLLGGVVATGLLDHRFGRFELNDTARRYLTTDGSASMRDLVPVSPGPLENWRDLTDTVMAGRPNQPIENDPATFYVPLVEGTFTTIHRTAMRADLRIRYSALTSPRVLDLGAGGAPWAIAVLGAVPDATAVVNDLDGVIDVAARKLDEFGVADRAELRPGDYHDIEIESGAFDLVVLGHVCRAEGEVGARRLIARAFDALAPGGRVVVSDYFCDRQRSQAPHALMMGVTMMASTRHGATFTYGECADWLRDAGFEALRLVEPIGFQQMFVASRPDRPPPTGGPR